MDMVQMAVDIELAKQQSPDIIIALMHWGKEYKLKPDTIQQQISEFLISNGVRLIIGSLIVRHRPREKGRTRYYIIPSNTLLDQKQLFSVADYTSLNQIIKNTRMRLNKNNKNFEEKWN
ncbi:hypothetical protein FACS1894123_09170 [Bacteroidia bacterium]|nr:hypothetical protein FACS1894123_09170 [Bacteroidia bacterium]